jgi:ribosomal protein L30E
MSINDIKKAREDNKLVVGTRTVMKGIKNGNIQSVFYASNCPDETVKDLEHYKKASKVSAEEIKGDSVKLGQTCGKPFTVLMVGIKK